MANKTLCIAWETIGEGNFLTKRHLEHLIGVLVHKRRSSHDKLVGKDAKCVPVCGTSMTYVQDNLRRDVFGSSTESVSTVPRLQTLHEAEIGHLNVATVLHENILRLQISIDQVLTMHVLENEYNLSTVKADECATHSTDLFENIEKLSVLQVVHQNIQVPAILSYTLHLT